MVNCDPHLSGGIEWGLRWIIQGGSQISGFCQGKSYCFGWQPSWGKPAADWLMARNLLEGGQKVNWKAVRVGKQFGPNITPPVETHKNAYKGLSVGSVACIRLLNGCEGYITQEQ